MQGSFRIRSGTKKINIFKYLIIYSSCVCDNQEGKNKLKNGKL